MPGLSFAHATNSSALSGRPPTISGDYERDCASFSKHWLSAIDVIAKLPQRRDRSADQQASAELNLKETRASRTAFLRVHAARVYRELTDNLTKFKRVEELAFAAATKLPGLCPTAEAVSKESALVQADKDGIEIDQGLFFNAVLADRECGMHLCHAMLLPKQQSLEKLDGLKASGRVDFDHACVHREGKASVVTLKNPRYLNAEDDSTLQDVETAVDLALLDPNTTVCVIRGGSMQIGKYANQRVFCTGINLTHIYYGRISYLWFLIRDLGFINKIYRGLAYTTVLPDELIGETLEKPWIAAVEKFAIGGGCQYLLVTDYNIACKDAYMTLPARKEGIIPGVANMRMPRFVGDRITRQAIMSELRIECDSVPGRQICDLIVDPADMDAAISDVVARLTNSGVVSASSNRKSMRVTQEPLDMFRQYMSVYAREQAYCHFSPALISNLERFWNAQNREV